MKHEDDKSARRDLATTLGHLAIEFGKLEASVEGLGLFLVLAEAKQHSTSKTDIEARHTAFRKKSYDQRLKALRPLYERVVATADVPFGDSFHVEDHLDWPAMGQGASHAQITFDDLQDALREVGRSRNEHLHADWLFPPSGDHDGHRLRTPPMTLQPVMTEHALEELDQVIREIEALNLLVFTLGFAIGVRIGDYSAAD